MNWNLDSGDYLDADGCNCARKACRICWPPETTPDFEETVQEEAERLTTPVEVEFGQPVESDISGVVVTPIAIACINSFGDNRLGDACHACGKPATEKRYTLGDFFPWCGVERCDTEPPI